MFFNHMFCLFRISSLKGRLRFWFMCFILLLVLFASIPFVIIEKQQSRQEAKIAIEKMIDVQQLVVDTWLKDRLANIKTVSQLPAIKSQDLSKGKEALEMFIQNHSEFTGMVYVNKQGITELDTSGPIGLDLSDRLYFQEAKKGNAIITDVIIGRQSGKPIVIISAPIFDDHKQFQGLIFGSVSIKTIENVMGGFEDENRETYLVGRDGTLITESRQGKVGEKIHTAIYQSALESKQLSDFYESTNGELVLGNYRWVHNNQWLIIGEINKSIIYQSFNHMTMIFSGVLLFLVLIGYVLMIFVSKQIEKPIQHVLEATKKIGEGNWKYRLPQDTYKEDAKELQELSANFNHMAELIEMYIYSFTKSEERFRMISEYSSDMITIHDYTGKYLYVSPAGKEILQYEDFEVVGYDSFYIIHPDDREMIKEKFEMLINTGYVVSTYRIRRKDGEYIWFESSINYMKEDIQENSRIVTISRNVTERKLVEQQLQEANKLLQELSTKDGLTGIWNRRSFDEYLRIEWNRSLKNGHSLSLIMLDIDFFKTYNDTYGHQGGDDCLKEVASVLSRSLKRESDRVFRYGGEEFGIILPETDKEEVNKLAENIRSTVERLNIPHTGSRVTDHVTISLGTTTIIPSKYGTPIEFIEAADKALYQAKQEGRNCFRSYNQNRFAEF